MYSRRSTNIGALLYIVDQGFKFFQAWFDGGGSAGATSFVGSDGGGGVTTPVGNAIVGCDDGVERKYSVASAKRISKSAR